MFFITTAAFQDWQFECVVMHGDSALLSFVRAIAWPSSQGITILSI